jgi:hypothetical protein
VRFKVTEKSQFDMGKLSQAFAEQDFQGVKLTSQPKS